MGHLVPPVPWIASCVAYHPNRGCVRQPGGVIAVGKERLIPVVGIVDAHRQGHRALDLRHALIRASYRLWDDQQGTDNIVVVIDAVGRVLGCPSRIGPSQNVRAAEQVRGNIADLQITVRALEAGHGRCPSIPNCRRL